jgi:hypothetical protein
LIDTITLDQVFDSQKRILGLKHFKTVCAQQLDIDTKSMVDRKFCNFVEHGSLLYKMQNQEDQLSLSGLAIDEICPTMSANLNFSNSDCIQMLVLDGGLSPLKVTMHYQLI